MTLQSVTIAPFRTGWDTDSEPWAAPPDSFSIISNLHIKHGYLEKRNGYNLLSTLSTGNRVMGISRYIQSDNTKVMLAFDTQRAHKYNGLTKVFDVLDAAAIMSGSATDYIWTVNWQSSGGNNNLYFTNGKAYDGVSLDGIRYYTGTALVTVSFVPALDNPASRYLWGAKLLFSIKQRLVALNTYERTGGSTVNFPQRARWCQAQGPNNWDDITPGGGGFVDAPTGDHIISARQIQDSLIVFCTDSVWTLRPTSDPALPFRWDKINSFRACDGKMASVGYDRYATALGARGITATDGVETRRIDERISDFVADEIDKEDFGKVFCERDYQNKRWWTLYTSINSTENNKVLIYDDDSQAYSTYDLSMNCLGYGNLGFDYGFDDFSVANNLDWTWLEAGHTTFQDYFFQDNQEVFLGGDTAGNIFNMNTSGTDNSATIEAEFVTAAWNPYKEEGLETTMSYVDFFIDTDPTTTARIDFYKDNIVQTYSSKKFDFLPNLDYQAQINGITQANPAAVACPDHGLSTGDVIYIYGVSGMEEINGGPYAITVVNANNFTLDGIDSTAFTAYTNGGIVVLRPFYKTKMWKRVYAGGTGYQHKLRFIASGADTPFRIHAMRPYFKRTGRRQPN